MINCVFISKYARTPHKWVVPCTVIVNRHRTMHDFVHKIHVLINFSIQINETSQYISCHVLFMLLALAGIKIKINAWSKQTYIVVGLSRSQCYMRQILWNDSPSQKLNCWAVGLCGQMRAHTNSSEGQNIYMWEGGWVMGPAQNVFINCEGPRWENGCMLGSGLASCTLVKVQ